MISNVMKCKGASFFYYYFSISIPFQNNLYFALCNLLSSEVFFFINEN